MLLFEKKIGVTGSTIKIDKYGDSEGNFSVLAIQPHTSGEPLRDNFSCNYLMTPVAHFQQGSDFPVSFISYIFFPRIVILWKKKK